MFYIQADPQDGHLSNVELYTVVGEKIMDFGPVTEIDLSEEAAGIYFIVVELANQQRYTQKVSLLK